jgi:hypothetical protein
MLTRFAKLINMRVGQPNVHELQVLSKNLLKFVV